MGSPFHRNDAFYFAQVRNQGFQLFLVQHASQVSQVDNPQSFCFDQEQKGFAPPASPCIIMKSAYGSDLNIRLR